MPEQDHEECTWPCTKCCICKKPVPAKEPSETEPLSKDIDNLVKVRKLMYDNGVQDGQEELKQELIQKLPVEIDFSQFLQRNDKVEANGFNQCLRQVKKLLE